MIVIVLSGCLGRVCGHIVTCVYGRPVSGVTCNQQVPAPPGPCGPYSMLHSSHTLESWSESELTDPAIIVIAQVLTIVKACSGTVNDLDKSQQGLRLRMDLKIYFCRIPHSYCKIKLRIE